MYMSSLTDSQPLFTLKHIVLFCSISVLATCNALLAKEVTKINTAITDPWGVSILDHDQLIVTSKTGAVHIVNLDSDHEQDVGNIPEVNSRNQGGLLDITTVNRNGQIKVFLCYSKPLPDGTTTLAITESRLIEYQLINQKEIFQANYSSRSGHHFGCRLVFKGSSLFATLGDRGKRQNAQDPNTHAGAIIRLFRDVNNKENGWNHSIYSTGHRNPQGLIFDKKHGELWSHEHGPRGGDEINVIHQGANYGWPLISYGKEYIGGKIGLDYSPPGYTDPVWTWIPSIAPSGMILYRGSRFPSIKGHLLVGSLKFGRIVAVKLDNKNRPISETNWLENLGRVRDIEELSDGRIVVLIEGRRGGIYVIS